MRDGWKGFGSGVNGMKVKVKGDWRGLGQTAVIDQCERQRK